MSQFADEFDEDYYRDDLNDEDHEEAFYNPCGRVGLLEDYDEDEELEEEEEYDSRYDYLGD
jgi:hypothetical protein